MPDIASLSLHHNAQGEERRHNDLLTAPLRWDGCCSEQAKEKDGFSTG